ncbi:MAG TPA: glycosyl hydrolase, partial [Ohtaekwangia sp.]|nr:glycosyl hydrolase [Ohtaekwangia sp.]
MPDLLFKPCSMVSCTTAAKNKHFGPFNSKRRLPCFIYFLPICAIVLALQGCRQSSPATWPTIERETRPWSRWWWHGSALTPEGITAEMEAYQKAGIGGLEITPIYGVYGDENNFVDYLSPRWMELLMHTLREAARLDMGIDMATGTGWPFGGPWVSDDDACKNFEYRIYALREGQSLNEAVEFKQQPYLRAVGNLIYNRYNRAFF